jgi:hypothetical protein
MNMNAFEIRRKLVEDYSTYIRSFVNIRDEVINRCVQEGLTSGLLWPDPLVQLNPARRQVLPISARSNFGSSE